MSRERSVELSLFLKCTPISEPRLGVVGLLVDERREERFGSFEILRLNQARSLLQDLLVTGKQNYIKNEGSDNHAASLSQKLASNKLGTLVPVSVVRHSR